MSFATLELGVTPRDQRKPGDRFRAFDCFPRLRMSHACVDFS
jgi:hypothetical protein